MLDFTASVIALKQILFEKKNYNDVLFHTFMVEKLSREGKKALREEVVGVLRHHNCLEFECLELFRYGKVSDEILLAMVALYSARAIHQMSDEDFRKAYQTTAERLRLDNDASKDVPLILEARKKPFHIPEEVKESPYRYNSLMLEVPEFLLMKLAKDYSPKDALSIAVSLHQKPHEFYGIDERKGNRDALIADDNFTAISLMDKTTVFKAEKALSLSEAKAVGLYPLSYPVAYAYSKIELPVVAPKVLLMGVTNSFSSFPLALSTLDSYDSEIIPVYERAERFRFAVDNVKAFDLNNVKPLLSSIELVKTYLSYDHFDLVVCFGKDSDIGLARRRPDILPALLEKDAAKHASESMKSLSESGEFVKKGGKLLFVNHAITKDEGKKVIRKFLSEKKDFSLLEDGYILPSMMDSDGGYYAIMEKNHD